MSNSTNRLSALSAQPPAGGNADGAPFNHDAGSPPSGARRLFNIAVLACLASKDEALEYITATVESTLTPLGAVLQAQLRALDAGIRFLRTVFACIEADLANLPRHIPETEPSPHWPEPWPMRCLAVLLLALIGGLAVLGLVNTAQFAVITTNSWWTATLFAAPMLAVPFAAKYGAEVVPQKHKPSVYFGLGVVGMASVGLFIFSFANRFGINAALADPANVTNLLAFNEDNRLQLAAQMLTELSCGTVLVLWFRRLMLGSIRYIPNPVRQPLVEDHDRKQAAVTQLELEAGKVKGQLDTLPHRRKAKVTEGLAIWYAKREEASVRAHLQDELAVAA